MTPAAWLRVFIAWRAAMAATLAVGAVVAQDWRTVLLAFAAGALTVDTVYLSKAARMQWRRP